ncbi:putative thiamine pyrophosphate-requiring enzyme, partial [Parachaetomium inaequale]
PPPPTPSPHPLPPLPSNTTNPLPHSPTTTHATATTRITITTLTQTLYATIPPSHLSLLRLPLGFHGPDLITTHPLSHLGQDGGAGTGSGPGNAVGAAVALKHAHPHLIPVAVLGDGDFLMGCSALWTAVHHKIPLLVVVANNEGYYNDERHQRDVARERGRDVGNAGVGTRIREPVVDLMGVAVAFGATRVVQGRVEQLGELRGALERAVGVVREGGVVVVDVLVWNEDMEEGGGM